MRPFLAPLVLGCVLAVPARAAESPRALLERAIKAGGGERRLDEAKALLWDGEATIHLPDQKLSIVGTWRLEPPDRAIVETRIAGEDPKTARTLSIAGASGFMQRDGQTTPLPAELVEHERGQFYLYFVLRLVPLRDPAFVLEPLPPDEGGHPGFRVRHAERPTVDVYLDVASLPLRLIDEIQDPTSGAKKRQVVTLSGDLTAGGIHWPRELRITWDGQPYFDLTISNLKVQRGLGE